MEDLSKSVVISQNTDEKVLFNSDFPLFLWFDKGEENQELFVMPLSRIKRILKYAQDNQLGFPDVNQENVLQG